MGGVLIVVGSLLAKWQIYDPLHAAAQGRQNVWLLSELVAAGVFLPAAGILLLVFGRRVNQWFAFDPQHLNWKSTACLLAVGAAGLAVFFFVLAMLEKQGYVIKHGW
jgi:hypothetical protein